MTKHLAGWTAAVVALILAASSAHAGRLPTPGKDRVRVGPFDEVTYTERFVGDEIALVTVDGDGSTQLEVDVLDQNGNLIDSDVRSEEHTSELQSRQ